MRHTRKSKRSTPGAPITLCRDMAAEAEKMAADAPPARRAKYLDLARQWTELADEMERAMARRDQDRAAAE